MTRNPVKSAGPWMARTVAVVLLSACMSPTVDAAAEETYETAQALLATDPAAGAAMLDRLARGGEFRAQLALGPMLIDGRGVPQDKALGLAFVKLGATHPFVTHEPKLGPKARAMLQQYELNLPGSVLIAADRLTADITLESDRRLVSALQAKLGPYTQEQLARRRPKIEFVNETVRIAVPPAETESQPTMIGCALDRRHVKGSCGGAPAQGAPGHCTGEIARNDTPATAMSSGIYFRTPEIPPKLKRSGLDIQTTLLAHVDSSGYVCTAVVTASSGHPEFDRNTLAAVRTWRLSPATKGGVPVEALFEFNSRFVSR